MKINFLVPCLRICGGIKIILEYAARLGKKGHETKIFCLKNAPSNELSRGWFNFDVEIIKIPAFSEKYIDNADIIMATTWKEILLINKFGWNKGAKIHFIQGDEMFIQGDGIENHKTIPIIKAWSLPIKKIVVSSWLKKMVKEKFNQNATLIPNAVDKFSSNKKYHKSKIVGVCFSAPQKIKCFLDAIKAFKLAKQKFSDIRLIGYGNGVPNKEITFYKFYYQPSQKRIKKIYNQCDIWLCASKQEGFGLPSLEAMAHKVALVTTDNLGCREYAIHNQTALISPPNDPKKLASNLVKLLKNDSLLKKIALNGFKKSKKFTWDKSIIKIEKIFRQEIKKRLKTKDTRQYRSSQIL